MSLWTTILGWFKRKPVKPAPVTTADPELVASGSFTRPALALDASIWPGIAAEGPGMGSVYHWAQSVTGWAGGRIAEGSKATALRAYCPDIEPCYSGWAVSWRWGNKEGGKLHGPGLWINGKVIYPDLTTGAARLATGPVGVVILTKNGVNGIVRPDGVSGVSTWPAIGSTGEKYSLAIGPDGRWAGAVNGYSLQDGSLAIGTERHTVATYAAYPAQSDDLCYPCAAWGPDGAAWFASVFDGALRVNSVKAGAVRWPADALPSLGNATMTPRCPPRLLAVQGRLWAFWTCKGSIMRADVEAVLAGTGKPVKVATGEMPDVALGADGRVRMVWVCGGAVKYKTMD